MKKIKVITNLEDLTNLPIGSIVKLNTANKHDYIKILKCDHKKNRNCANCYFHTKGEWCTIKNIDNCSGVVRKDKICIMFKKVTKLELLKKILW